MRERVRGLHYSLRTEEAYVFWCRDFVRFHGLRHPVEIGGPEVEAFLTHLAAQRGLSVSSHRQALSALLFLYGKVLGQQLPWMDEIGRPVPKRRLPVVLSAQKVAAVLAELDGVHGLLAPQVQHPCAPSPRCYAAKAPVYQLLAAPGPSFCAFLCSGMFSSYG